MQRTCGEKDLSYLCRLQWLCTGELVSLKAVFRLSLHCKAKQQRLLHTSGLFLLLVLGSSLTCMPLGFLYLNPALAW